MIWVALSGAVDRVSLALSSALGRLACRIPWSWPRCRLWIQGAAESLEAWARGWPRCACGYVLELDEDGDMVDGYSCEDIIWRRRGPVGHRAGKVDGWVDCPEVCCPECVVETFSDIGDPIGNICTSCYERMKEELGDEMKHFNARGEQVDTEGNRIDDEECF